ncbi:nucleoprotein TPR-like isoform X2 [Neocloeon triangulifer]|uniref:nucleoprotein TPR-like isoform X2 n=1 Tax=Neocloeon triangulifer TaxID=2078957 RepID=UPI00286F080A|nr:nucleoprotein TPR-like isoform X2 [Neocloeon triangulifer]
MDPKEDPEEVAVSDDEGGSPASNPGDDDDDDFDQQNPPEEEEEASEYEDDDVEPLDEEEDDVDDRFSAQAQPPSQSRSPEVEVLSVLSSDSDEDDDDLPPAMSHNRTIALSSSPMQVSDRTEEEDVSGEEAEEEVDDEEEMQQGGYETEEMDPSEEEQSADEEALQITEEGPEDPASEKEEEDIAEAAPSEAGGDSSINYKFSKPFEPTEPLDLPHLDPLTQDLMDSVEELKVLPDSVLTKLTNIWAAKDRELKNLKDQLSASEDISSTSKFEELESNFAIDMPPVEQTLEALNEALLKKHKEVKLMHLQRDSAQSREKEVLRQLRCKDEEVQRIAIENKNLSAQLTLAITTKCDASLKLQSIEGREIELNNKEWRLNQENASYKANLKNVTEKLDSTARELTQLKHEMSVKVTDLEILLRESRSEVERAESAAASLKETLAQEERRIESLLEKLREARDAEISIREAHNQEINAKVRIAKLYEEQYKEAEKVNSQYISTINELQITIREAAEKCGEYETRAETQKVDFEREIEQKNKMIFDLRDELKNANALIKQLNESIMEEQVAAIAPSASSARQMIHANLTFTEIYNMYKNKENELELVKAENEELRASMAATMNEIEEKVPLLSKEREVLNMTMMENERIVGDYDKLAQELEVVKEEALQARRNVGLIQREKQRMQNQIDDLSRQVVVLLREVEALNSRRPTSRSSFSESYMDYSRMTPSEMLSHRLVPFRDIEELQTRNIELLAAIRELSKEAEEEAQLKESGMDISSLVTKLENAVTELNEMKEKECHNRLLIEQLTEQRNQFRDISQHGRGSHDVGLSPMKFDASPRKRAGPLPPLNEDKELNAQLVKAKDAFNNLNKAFDALMKEKTDESASLNKEIEKLKEKIEEKNIVVAKLNALCEHKEGKLTSALDKIKDLTKQGEALQAKCKSQAEFLSNESKKRQDSMNELHNLRCSLNRKESDLNKARAELENARMLEESLRKECSTWKKSYEERGSIQASVEQMRVALEKSRTEGSEILIRQLDESRLEAASSQKRLQEEIKRYGDELKQLKSALDQERANVLKEQANTEAAKDEKLIVQAQLSQALRDVQALRAHRNPSVDSSIQTEVFVSEEVVREKIMAQRASEYEVLVQSLKLELARAKSSELEFKNIADATEKSVVNLKEAVLAAQSNYEECKAKYEESEKCMKEVIENLERELSETTARVQTASAEATEQLEIVKRELADMKSENQQLQIAVDESLVLKSALTAAEEESRRVGERLTYETEQNMKNMQIMEDLKNQISIAASEKAAVVEELEQYKKLVAQLELDLDDKEMKLAEASSGHEQALLDIRQHNDALHNQIQTMSAELSAIKQGTFSERKSLFGEGTSQLNISSISTDDSQSAEQLMQIIKHLRSEKESLTLQCDEFRSKWMEAKVRMEILEQQLEEATRRGASDTPEGPELVTRARYEEVERRIETMNVLKESANLNREECVELKKDKAELEQRVASLLQEVADYQAKARRFEEMAGTLQAEFKLARGEADRWRTCANQLTEKANQANPEELKKLLQERENLQKQLQAEREALSREREESRKLRVAIAEKDQQLTSVSAECAQSKASLGKVSEDHQKLITAHTELTDKHKDLTSKELTVRRIAKKYKTQYDSLVVEVKQKDADRAVAGAEEAEQVKELQAKLEESEKRVENAEATVHELEGKLQENEEQLTTKENELIAKQSELEAQITKGEKLRDMLSKASKIATEKKSVAEKAISDKEISEKEVARVAKELDEAKGRMAALQSNFEGKFARLEKEKLELMAQMEALQAVQQQPQQQVVEQQRVVEEKPQVIQHPESQQASASDGKSLMRTANVPPLFASQGRGRGQSAAVTPTTRGTPTALLKPMKAETEQVQAPSAAVTLPASAEPSTSGTRPPQTVRATPRAETQSTEASGQDGQDDGPSNANVLFVRPHEIHPAASSSQVPTAGQAPSSSQVSLKRVRDGEAPSLEVEEPRSKQMKNDSSLASVEVEEDEEASSALESQAEEDIALAVSDDEEEEQEEMIEQVEEIEVEKQEEEIMAEEEEENDEDDDDEDEEDEDDQAESMEDQNEDDDNPPEGDGGSQEFEEEAEEGDEGNADDVILTGEDQDLETQEGQEEQLAEGENDDENEVLILDDDDEDESEPTQQNLEAQPSEQQPTHQVEASSSSSVVHEPPSRSMQYRPPPPSQAQLSLPQHQGYEEVGDFGIVPSTPTLFARQNVFSDSVSSAPQVPQVTQSRLTASQEQSSHAVSTLQSDRLEAGDDQSTGRSVPTTPLLSSPQETLSAGATAGQGEVELEDDPADSDLGDVPSSSSTVPTIHISPAQGEESFQQEQASPASFARGNRARRSGGNFGPGRARLTRPTPIVWGQPEEQPQPPQQLTTRGRMTTGARRSRPSRSNRGGNPFQPLDFM